MTPDFFYILLLGVALAFRIFQPRTRNYLYGYRSQRSRKSALHWRVANNYSSNLLLALALVLAFVHFGLGAFGLSYDNALVGLLLVGFGLIVYLTEKKLKTIDHEI